MLLIVAALTAGCASAATGATSSTAPPATAAPSSTAQSSTSSAPAASSTAPVTTATTAVSTTSTAPPGAPAVLAGTFVDAITRAPITPDDGRVCAVLLGPDGRPTGMAFGNGPGGEYRIEVSEGGFVVLGFDCADGGDRPHGETSVRRYLDGWFSRSEAEGLGGPIGDLSAGVAGSGPWRVPVPDNAYLITVTGPIIEVEGRELDGLDIHLFRVPACREQAPTLIGTSGHDELTATPRDDVIVTLGGDDAISGVAPDDAVCSGHLAPPGGIPVVDRFADGPLNVRSGPGIAYGVVGAYAAGEAVATTGTASLDVEGRFWYEVERAGEVGWVAAWHLKETAAGTGAATTRGVIRDGRNRRPLGMQYEPGAPGITIAAVDASGVVTALSGNACDGSYTIEVPGGRFALAATPYSGAHPDSPWVPAWAAGGPLQASPADLYTSMEQQTPLPAADLAGAVWFDAGSSPEIDIVLPPGEGEPSPAAWYDEPPPPPTLPAEWRDPAWWQGRSVSMADGGGLPAADAVHGGDARRLSVDGAPVALGTARVASIPGASSVVVFATAYPEAAGDPCWRANLGFVLLLTIEGGTVRSALPVETGSTGFLCPAAVGEGGQTPRDLLVLGHRTLVCDLPHGPVDRAWRPGPSGLQEVGVQPGWSYLYPY